MNPQQSQNINPQLPQPEGVPPYTVDESLQNQSLNSSHVTVQPQAMPGHNFDPKLRTQYANEPDVIHAARPIEPAKLEVSPELQAKHEQSKRDYPYLNLSEGEFVILNLQRHPIGLMMPIIGGVFVIVLLLSALFLYPTFVSTYSGSNDAMPGFGVVALCVLPVCLLVGLFTYITTWVYLQNQFFLTNESVIQEIQHGLFSRHEQTVSLGSIEDASFKQNGILQTMLNYGSIRLSTEGEETTYRFYYVSRPKDQVARLNNAVESFKNGRPVE